MSFRSGHALAFTFTTVMCLFLAGCNSGQEGLSPDAAAVQLRENSLNEVAELLRLYMAGHKGKPPTKSAQLAAYEVGLPSGYLKVKQGDVVVIWNNTFSEGASDTIIAYEKAAPESGGYVLMQDGTTIKELSADDFKTAKKAPGGDHPAK